MKIAIPMYKRIMHDVSGELTEQFYGNESQAIYSVSRAQLNVVMMKLAEENGAEIYFNEQCIDIDFKKSKVFLKNTMSGKKLDTDDIKKFAPNIVEGTKRLVDWSKSL